MRRDLGSMRGGAWIACALLLAACTRLNEAYEGGGAGASSTEADDDPKTDAATTGGSGGAEGDATTVTTGGSAAETTLSMEGPDPTTGPHEEGSTTSMTDGATTTGDVPPEACCFPAAPCGNEEVSTCACTADPECCVSGWSLYCVALAVSHDCLQCGPPPPHGCCEANLMPGCNDFGVMACVCFEHPECCETQWGATCVEAASTCRESPCE